MSYYTIELRKVSQVYGEETVIGWFKDYNIEDYLTSQQIADITSQGLWSKDKLAQKIYDHYYMREIGYETPEMFRHFVKIKMQEIMEAKLPVIWSKTIEYDPLVNVDYKESYTRNILGTNTNTSTSNNNESVGENRTTNSSGNSASTGTSTGSNLSVESDTPQGQISKAEILQGKYASKTNANESESSTEANVSSNDTQTTNDNILRNATGSLNQSGTDNKAETYTRSMKGNSGVMTTAQKLIMQYREAIVAVDREIIEELNSLFFGLF